LGIPAIATLSVGEHLANHRAHLGNVLSTLIGDEDSKSTMSGHHHTRGIEHQ